MKCFSNGNGKVFCSLRSQSCWKMRLLRDFSNTVCSFKIDLFGQLKMLSLEFFSSTPFQDEQLIQRFERSVAVKTFYLWSIWVCRFWAVESIKQHVLKIHACVILLKWLDLFLLLTSHFQLQRISWLCLCRHFII